LPVTDTKSIRCYTHIVTQGSTSDEQVDSCINQEKYHSHADHHIL